MYLSSKLKYKLLLLPLALLTLLIYFPALSGPFVLDDWNNLASNIIVNSTINEWLSVINSSDGGHIGRPVARISFALNSYFFGLDSFSYKLTNLFLHLASGFLIYTLSTKLLNYCHLKSTDIFKISLLTTFIWLIHPLQVSTVLYVVQRMTILSALFSVLGIITYMQARWHFNASGEKHKHCFFYFFLTFFCWLPLAYLSKENGILLLGFILLIEWAFLSIKTKEKNRLKGISLLILIVISILFILKIEAIASGYINRDFTLYERLLTQANVLWLYIYLICFPNENNMALYHDAFHITQSLDLITTLAIAGHISLIVAVFFLKKQYPIIFFGVLWFYIGHLLESTIIALEMVFEHRNYLPLFGPILIFSYYFYLLIKPLSKILFFFIIFALLFILIIQTELRVQDWKSNISLAVAQFKKQPDSVRAHSKLSAILYEKNQHIDAIAVLKSSLKKNPNNIQILLQYNSLFCKNISLPSHIAKQTVLALSHTKKHEAPINKLALLVKIYQQGKCDNLEPYLIRYIDALDKNVELKKQHNSKASLYFLKAKFYTQKKNIHLAEKFYEKAYASDQSSRSWRILLEQAEFYFLMKDYTKCRKIIAKIKEKHLNQNKIASNDFNRRYNKLIKKLEKNN